MESSDKRRYGSAVLTVKRILEQLLWHHKSTEMVTVSENKVSVSENCANVVIYEGESNENLKSAIKIRNTARLSCKLTTVILMVLRVADRWQYDAGMQRDGAVVV